MNDITVTDYPPHDEDWYPGKSGTRYTFETALAEAKRYVEGFPLESQPPEARIFMHAILDYFKELGVSRDERDRILSAWTTQSLDTWEHAFGIGWDKGYEYGKSKTAPPF